jgi:hypothetical protein
MKSQPRALFNYNIHCFWIQAYRKLKMKSSGIGSYAARRQKWEMPKLLGWTPLVNLLTSIVRTAIVWNPSAFLVLIHALNVNGCKSGGERAPVHLTDKGVMKACTENNAYLYPLTEDETIRSWVLELAKLQWHHWQLALGKAHSIPVKRGTQRQIGSLGSGSDLF